MKRFGAVVLPLLMVCAAGASTIAHLSLQEITLRSEMILSGRISDSWAEWDSSHKYIWTHYTVTMESTVKGRSRRTVEVAEPGGIMGTTAMFIGGATGYRRGERVLIFLERMPNGYLRTAGLGQGKYGIDQQNRVHGIALPDGVTLAEATQQISRRLR